MTYHGEPYPLVCFRDTKRRSFRLNSLSFLQVGANPDEIGLSGVQCQARWNIDPGIISVLFPQQVALSIYDSHIVENNSAKRGLTKLQAGAADGCTVLRCQ